LSAAFARGKSGPPAFLYVDEFQDFVDEEATPRHLRLAREYNLGMILAHQQVYCNEFNDSIRSSVSSTTIKYCSKVFGQDRSYMLRDLGCEEAFLDAQTPDHKNHTVKFACVLKGQPPVSVAVDYPNIVPSMQMDEADYDNLLHHNSQRLHPSPIARSAVETSSQVDVPIQSVSPSSLKATDSDAASDYEL
jgi:hypothetical protein